MALTDRLFDNARVQLPGAIDSALRTELWNVVNDFCRETYAWQEVIEVPIAAGDATYTIAPAGTVVLEVLNLAHETMDLTGAMFEFGTLVLPAAPSSGDALYPVYATVALAPDLSAGADPENLIPEDMWTTYFQVLLEGLLGHMMGQAAKPYSNPTLALAHLRNYRSKRSEARHRQRLNYNNGRTWRFPRWA